jgi:geranylgeranyl diphosphate synthase, type II
VTEAGKTPPLTNYFILIETYLDTLVPPKDAEPRPLYEAIRYSLFSGGKRIRPTLTLAVADTLGAEAERLLPVAAAIEMVHTYSLIHDDLPSMDNDDFRRGKPTNHKVFGEAIAILAGDALLTAGFAQIASAPYSAEISRRLAMELALSIGPKGMLGGQVLDMLANATGISDLEKLHRMKTGALISFSTVAPAFVLQASEAVVAALREYGQSVGLTFQITDDILDVEEEKTSYTSMLGVEESRRLARELTARAISSVQSIDRLGYLTSLANFILERNK